MPVIKNAAPMGQTQAPRGPYDPTKPESMTYHYFKAVEKDLQKRFGKGKNPPYKKGNKIAL